MPAMTVLNAAQKKKAFDALQTISPEKRQAAFIAAALNAVNDYLDKYLNGWIYTTRYFSHGACIMH